MYCSKECQTRNWPEHKHTCGEPGIAKLIKTLMANPILLSQLQACFILTFDLLRRARSDELLFARLDVAVEPSDLVDFADLFLGVQGSLAASEKQKVPGMLQAHSFTPDLAGRFTAEREALWRRERVRADSEGCRDEVVAILDIVHANMQPAMTFPIQIPSLVKEPVATWVTEGFEMTEGTRKVLYTAETCLEIINTHIGADSNNKLLLRTQMRQRDIQAIRDCTAISASNVAAAMLHAKIAREHVYREIYQTYLEGRKAATGVIPKVPGFKFL
ncbi:hypothetical protein C8R45DRAFT_1046560 [Mycena sanguinolenta]|nr:hypothetical protein C8R45DRAFT_1046560 [Mycena sanguinolenta]